MTKNARIWYRDQSLVLNDHKFQKPVGLRGVEYSKNPLVSLIMDLKNGMPFLAGALESVAKQTYKNIELVVQDGVSTDGSLEYLRNFKQIKKVLIESRADKGPAQAWNQALQRCKGSIVGLIDSDNALVDNAVEIAVSYFKKYSYVAVLYGRNKIIDKNGRLIEESVMQPYDSLALLSCEFVPPFDAAFFSKELCVSRIKCEEDLTCADFGVWLRVSDLPILTIPEIIVATRRSKINATSRSENYARFCRDKIIALERFFSRYEKNMVMDTLLRKSTAGIYSWGALSVFLIEGNSKRFTELYLKSLSLDPHSKRVKDLGVLSKMDNLTIRVYKLLNKLKSVKLKLIH